MPELHIEPPRKNPKIVLNGGRPLPQIGPQRISKNDLRVDTYQRPEQLTLIKRIITQFDPDQFKTLEVSYRDGVFWIVDGMQRWSAAKRIDELLLLRCEVHFWTRDKEVEQFCKSNQTGARQNMSPLDLHRARLELNDHVAIELTQAVTEAEMTLNLKEEHKPVLGCLSTIRAIFQYNEERGRWVVAFLGLAAKADHKRRGRYPKIKIYIVEALGRLYDVNSIRDNSENLAKHVGQTLGLEDTAQRMKPVVKSGRAEALATLLEFDRPKKLCLIDHVEVATKLKLAERERRKPRVSV